MRAYPSIFFLALAFFLFSPTVRDVRAIEYDLKITGTAYSAFFPEIESGPQEDVVAFVQIKPDLALFLDDTWQAIIAPRFRLGVTDSEYNFVSFDDVYGEYIADQFEVRAGFQTYFWGAVESFNIVDVLNQKDYVIDFFEPKTNKIGEPAIRARMLVGEHRFEFYYFPYFTPANLPNKVNPLNPFEGRLDFSDDPFYTNASKRLRQQFALRWDHTIGSADIGLAYFNGYERFPVINQAPGAMEADTLYYEMQQVSGDIQISLGNWLLKGEVLYLNTGIAGSFASDSILPDGNVVRRDLVPDNLTAVVGGFEYTFFRVLGQSDLGVIVEYLYNSQQDRDAVGFRPFENDVFAALRWSRNNPGDGELLAGLILDVRNQTRLLRVEYEERFFDQIKLEAIYEHIQAASEDPIALLNNADRLAIQLSYVY